MSEFKPTRKDLLALEEKIIQLKVSKRKIVERKRKLETSLSLLQEKYKDVEYQSEDFKKIKSQRAKLKEEAATIELEIVKINDEISYKRNLKSEVEFFLKSNQNEELLENNIVKSLLKLRDKYASFSKDRTRVSSMRLMAAEFRDEIEGVIKTSA